MAKADIVRNEPVSLRDVVVQQAYQSGGQLNKVRLFRRSGSIEDRQACLPLPLRGSLSFGAGWLCSLYPISNVSSSTRKSLKKLTPGKLIMPPPLAGKTIAAVS